MVQTTGELKLLTRSVYRKNIALNQTKCYQNLTFMA